jgi:hypothetical protein
MLRMMVQVEAVLVDPQSTLILSVVQVEAVLVDSQSTLFVSSFGFTQ